MAEVSYPGRRTLIRAESLDSALVLKSQPGPDNSLPCIFYVAEWQQPRGQCVFQQHQCQDDIDQSRKTPSRAWLGVLRL
jgi:hypothetical protein